MRRIQTCILLALSFAPAALPQASSTTVRGIVQDQGQAVIPKASVTLTNTATSVARRTTTNEAGLYVFPGVFPGPHRITVEFSGMQKYDASLTVQVQQDATVDVVLQVGQTATQLEVKDVTPPGHHRQPDTWPFPRTAAHRAAPHQRPQLFVASGDRARHRVRQ